LITTLEVGDLPAAPPQGAVVSIGVFDGVHLGHQAILQANLARARALGARPTVVTFRQHPKQLLLGRSPRTLTSLEHRLELFRRAGVEHTLALTFDQTLREVPAEDFTRQVLVAALGARAFVLGFDSKFGHDRRGTPELLRGLGLDVEVVGKVEVGGRAVSSTAIREAVELGDLESAERMLGRPVSVLGTVVEGDRLGRELGFPTANLDLHHELHPPNGVYAGWARVLAPGPRGQAGNGPPRPAVANIGVRPTLDGQAAAAPRVEVHLLDFSGDLYGRDLEFEFGHLLREERRFGSLDELREQIGRDVSAAAARLGSSAREGA
jgi:riboflavin kinase/FMN adenylyltransferase